MLSAAAVPRAHHDHLAARRLAGSASSDPGVDEVGGVLATSDAATLAGDLVIALSSMQAGAVERGGPLPAVAYASFVPSLSQAEPSRCSNQLPPLARGPADSLLPDDRQRQPQPWVAAQVRDWGSSTPDTPGVSPRRWCPAELTRASTSAILRGQANRLAGIPVCRDFRHAKASRGEADDSSGGDSVHSVRGPGRGY